MLLIASHLKQFVPPDTYTIHINQKIIKLHNESGRSDHKRKCYFLDFCDSCFKNKSIMLPVFLQIV